jgi:hypothetical protein
MVWWPAASSGESRASPKAPGGAPTGRARRSRESQPRPALADLGMIAQTVAHGEGHPVAIAMPVPAALLRPRDAKEIVLRDAMDLAVPPDLS